MLLSHEGASIRNFGDFSDLRSHTLGIWLQLRSPCRNTSPEIEEIFTSTVELAELQPGLLAEHVRQQAIQEQEADHLIDGIQEPGETRMEVREREGYPIAFRAVPRTVDRDSTVVGPVRAGETYIGAIITF